MTSLTSRKKEQAQTEPHVNGCRVVCEINKGEAPKESPGCKLSTSSLIWLVTDGMVQFHHKQLRKKCITILLISLSVVHWTPKYGFPESISTQPRKKVFNYMLDLKISEVWITKWVTGIRLLLISQATGRECSEKSPIWKSWRSCRSGRQSGRL